MDSTGDALAVGSTIPMPGATSAATALESSSPLDPARIAVMLKEHHAFVWRCVRRFGVPESNVDDVVQETFIVTARRIADVEVGRERAFLTGTAIRMAANWRRSHRRAPVRAGLDELEREPSDSPSPEELLDRRRSRELLDRALDALPEKLRAPFVLSEIEGLTRTEVAELLELPPGTVATRVRRARERFEEEVKKMLRPEAAAEFRR